MGINYDIDLEKGRVIVVLEGKLNLQEIQTKREEMWADPKWRSNLNYMVELRLSDVFLTNDEMKVLFTETQNWRRVAIVVGSKGEEFGNKLQNRLKAVEGIRVFRNWTAAEEWVGAD